jgi:DNA excision repair protein ERCC-2
VLRTGDLAGERDFVGPRRALAGTRGHQRVQRLRPAGYQKEVAVGRDVEAAEFFLRVQGRIDGVMAEAEQVSIEEIKTVTGGWDRRADPLHWAQAKLYGCIYARDHGLEHLAIRLTYLDLDTGELTAFTERFTATDLSTFFDQTVAEYLDWVGAWHRWRVRRDESIRALAFPFAAYRPGQRELAVAAYRTIARRSAGLPGSNARSR